MDTGKFLSTWRKTDGKWLQVRDIFNMDPYHQKPLYPRSHRK